MTPTVELTRTQAPGQSITALPSGHCTEYHLSLTPRPRESARGLFQRLSRLLEPLDAWLVSVTVFGARGAFSTGLLAMEGEARLEGCPLTWVEGAACGQSRLAGIQAVAVSGAPVQTVLLENRPVARAWSDGLLRQVRLGGVLPLSPRGTPVTQARECLEAMEQALRGAGLGFPQLVRTWLFLDRILEWYGELNQVRTAFFRERDIFSGLLPASTGVGARNPWGTALVMAGLAVAPAQTMLAPTGAASSPAATHPRTEPPPSATPPRDAAPAQTATPPHAAAAQGEGVVIEEVASPLQGAAGAYGSSFSRAVSVRSGGLERLYVSGTASIGEQGQSLHQDAVEAQLRSTLHIVKRLLGARGMDQADVIRAVAYFKRAEDAVWLERVQQEGVWQGPLTLCAQDAICRDELLFELEVDAVK